jgi:hypothetical protein
MLLVLSSDYESGSVTHAYAEKCRGERQFEEKSCRQGVSSSPSLCQGRVRLEVRYTTSWCVPSLRDLQRFDAVVWGGGNHPVSNAFSYSTTNDAFLVSEHILRPTCDSSWKALARKVVYLLPHARLRYTRPSEVPHRVRSFAREMPAHLRRDCAVTRLVDPHGMTESLMSQVGEAAVANMTWDGAHWGRAVNVIKAWMILDELARGR